MHGRCLTNAWNSLKFFQNKASFSKFKTLHCFLHNKFNNIQLEYKPNMKDVMGINILLSWGIEVSELQNPDGFWIFF